MDNLRNSIQIIFGSNCPDKILKNHFKQTDVTRIYQDHLVEKDFLAMAFDQFKNYSLDEINNIYQKLDEDWLLDVYQNTNKSPSIYHLLIHFSKQVLKERNQEPFVSYEHLLRWRHLSHSLGEDLFTTSYLAYMDKRSGRKRTFFGWRSVLFSTNNRLSELLKQGVAENHFHLKGSAPIFELSWMALMNNVQDASRSFNELKKQVKLNSKSLHSFGISEKDQEILVYKAACIRKYLFEYFLSIKSPDKVSQERIEKLGKDLKKYCSPSSNKEKSFEIILELSKIQNQINQLKEIYGYRFLHFGNKVVADYAIHKNIHESNFKGSPLLVGERMFLYDCFTLVYSRDKDFKLVENLFYSYLTIKSQFRSELIQFNGKSGFGNFLTYQDRKEYFIPDDSIYSTAFIYMAVRDTQISQNIKSFEARIVPKNNAHKINNSLNKYNKTVNENSLLPTFEKISIDKLNALVLNENKKDYEQNFFYTVHFIKKPELKESKVSKVAQGILSRHHYLRKEVKRQARAIVQYRESYSKNSKLIKGIDAASSEFAARPEVFAQAFRYLKDHKLSGKYDFLREEITENKLYATYHAGEDFYDVVDGLRTIDEAIKFLKYCQGDRLGHALALGIDAKAFFEFKGMKLMIPKEILLDNISWLLAKIRKFNVNIFSGEISRLEKLYDALFREIYQSSFQEGEYKNKYFNHSTFHDAWKLRGDDPMLYLNSYKKDVTLEPNVTYWERCRLNYFYPKNSNIRDSPDIKFLYHEYHFNPEVKRKGKKIKQFTISNEYVQLVHEVQKAYQHQVKEQNIGIECNPTSNYLIGTFDQYEDHPIKDFYNLGLETDPEKINNCPQLFVSINTDDQGIFGTSLENEYALMAIALEKAKDEDGNARYTPAMIYQWLDNIRKMGLEQSFKNHSD